MPSLQYTNCMNNINHSIKLLSKYIIFLCLIFLPLFAFHGTALAQTDSEYDWFWFLYDYEKNSIFETTVYRPFFLKNITEKGTFSASLIPIIYWKYETKKKIQWKSLLGLVNSTNYNHSNGTNDYDFGVFPFFFYGDSVDQQDRYCMIWPFGGTLKGKLGHKRISTYIFPGLVLFFLFPPAFQVSFQTTAILISLLIPIYADYEINDYKAWSILWPIIQRGKSPNRDDKRCLPFYAHNFKKGYYDNYSFLMLFNYQKINLVNDKQFIFLIIPLYGRGWTNSLNSNSSSLLWPLFTWGYDKAKGDFELNFFWPLFQIQDCIKPYIKKRLFIPFYGKYEFKDSESFFITPLFYCLKKYSKDQNSEYYINAIIFWYFKRDYLTKPNPVYGNSWRMVKIWPLLKFEWNDKGYFLFNLLSLLPWRDPEGYEKLYKPFWTIIEYSQLQSGEKRFGLLFRTFFQRWSKNFIEIKIPFLFTFKKSKGNLNNISFLLSMFSYTNNNMERYLRLFWIPIFFENKKIHSQEMDDSPKKCNTSYSSKTKEITDVSADEIHTIHRNKYLYTYITNSIYYSVRIF